jgi:hypothetical protein
MTRIAAIVVILALVAGCAKVGTLDRPAPLFGEKAKAEYRAKKQAEAAAKATKPSNEPEPLPEPLPAEPPPVANPPVSGASEKINGQTVSPPSAPVPETPPAEPQ